MNLPLEVLRQLLEELSKWKIIKTGGTSVICWSIERKDTFGTGHEKL